jgi:hypothetical protein
MRLTRESGNPSHAAKHLLQRVRNDYEARLAEVITRTAASNSWANALENQLQKVLADSKDGGAWESVMTALPPAINDDGDSGPVEVRCIGWRCAKRDGWEVAQDEEGVAVSHWRFIDCPHQGRGGDDQPVMRHPRN